MIRLYLETLPLNQKLTPLLLFIALLILTAYFVLIQSGDCFVLLFQLALSNDELDKYCENFMQGKMSLFPSLEKVIEGFNILHLYQHIYTFFL